LVKIGNTVLSTCSDLFGYSRHFGLGVAAIYTACEKKEKKRKEQKTKENKRKQKSGTLPKIKRKRWLAN